jgi:hypothetical protein
MKAVLVLFGLLAAVPTLLFIALALFLAVVSRCNRQVGECRVCGCTDNDCRRCIARTGIRCAWLTSKHDLCTACVNHLEPADVDDLSPDCSPLNAVANQESRNAGRGWIC